MSNQAEQTKPISNSEVFSSKITRRQFMKIMGGLGASAAALAFFNPLPKLLKGGLKTIGAGSQSTNKFDVKRTICLQCHSGCGVQVTVANPDTGNEKAINIGGNPYHPNTGLPHLDYDTDPDSLVNADGYPIYSGKICAKGRSGLQTLYDPQRIKHPLKRVGPRGSGEWEVITWDQVYDDICGVNATGSDVSGSLPSPSGTGTYTFSGLKQIRADNPNKFVFMVGRSEHGRKELTDRIWKDGYGTKNHRNDHTSICELSHHVAYAMAFPGKTHVGTDIMNAEFILWLGTSPLEAGFPMLNLSTRLMMAKNPGGTKTPLKMVVVDPRFSRTAAKADLWLPVRPGSDAALACGMLAYMIDNGWYDEAFLRNANTTTANAAPTKEYAATDATHLVITQSGHGNERKFLTAGDIPSVILAPSDVDNHVITTDGSAGTAIEETGASAIGHLGIDPSSSYLDANFETLNPVTVDGIECKTVFQLLVEMVWRPLVNDSALGTTIDDLLAYYADECGEYVSVSTIKDLGTEFWTHGKKSVCNFYRGSVQHTNGTYTALALTYLNFLVGNIDRRGGMTTGGSHWHEMGENKAGTAYNLKTGFGPGSKASPSGLNIAREGATYRTEWQGSGSPTYPAERPFFQHTSNVWQEVVAGVRHGEGSEPASTGFYQPLAIWFHMANPNYSMPGAQLATKMLTDVDPTNSTQYKVPLAITTEIVMGETSRYCDYILPDVSYLERWASPHIAPNNLITCSGVRQPVLSEPLYAGTRVAEQIYIDVAKRLGLEGVGAGGFGTSFPTSQQDFNTVEDWYRKIIVNFALESKKVPKNDSEFYTIADWTAVSSNATQLDQLEDTLINYVLDRGGVFEDPDTAYADADGNYGGRLNETGQYVRKKWGKQVYFYIEDLATSENCMAEDAGVYFSGLGFYDRIKNARGLDIRTTDLAADYDFQVITYKTVLHTQSRSIACDWLTELEGTNGILINEEDAADLGVISGDTIKLTSRNGELEGAAVVTKGIMKKVVGVSHCFGHTEYGASDWKEDGITRSGITKRSAGISINPILRLDESLNDTVCLQDLIGGSASYYDTYVKVEKE